MYPFLVLYCCLPAGTPDAAGAFLVALAEGCRGQADEEVATLTRLKRKDTGNTGKL
jgi:hypothetical protein